MRLLQDNYKSIWSNNSVIYLFLQVEIPKGKYSGQKLTKLVNTNTTARVNNIIPKVPEIVFVKYKPAISTAIATLTNLSIFPIFAFIVVIFRFIEYL